MHLLNPGPVTLSERVRRSMLAPDLCHRESEFFDLQDEARQRLLAVYGIEPAEWCAVLITASGTGAVEGMVSTLVPPDGRVLVAENGVYGERMAQICARYRIAHERMTGDWMRALDLSGIARRVENGPRDGGARFTHIAVVHHETTTGRLNDLRALGELCRQHGTKLLVDAVSSFGAEPLDFADESLAAVAATANKCLHGVPGVAFAIVRRRALERAASRTYYLDLARAAAAQDRRDTPFTPAVQAHYALLEALREHAEEGGWPARHRRYAALAEQVRAGLARLGVTAVLPPEESSVVLRSYGVPAGASYAMLHDGLKARGFVIYAGQGNLSERLFRISTMGDLSAADMDRLLVCCGELLR
ncbi:MAG TPA: 2-aminoethylphosphonate aminotransferase [Steroidobacteraceae bacterium]|jgi:2-aminoethylphosphonate-pyruvate transaminase|nr:2-aminoethylphosphonate aminotransferase [Steroidobacteraceae bacterium]